ncbi:multidrug effflux MFS transporter [Simkania negevensis]|uniref:Multidrug resistance transporter, Bcr family n=1 Tax=Simkania negevensis (strain ATCC VR-1471 / DSM 27360 / Z) TaxID=331113 RepID=F8L6L6_SIMNZ|nr:multidrug effflux MFS transporter [Simkania negevensis]CCB88363.1 multidrug resistance transporter, Bcr family [Simkania negevensis Z]
MKKHVFLFSIIVLAACLTQFASDIYAPSLPGIAVSLQTDMDWVQWSLSIYMVGVALSQLIYGPISEGVGRKKPILIGLSILFFGSIVCAFAPNIFLLIAGRLIQGCGAGAVAALWRSIFRDIFKGEELAKYTSYLVIFIMFIVPAAPALGGYFEHYLGWRSTFFFMLCYTIVALCAVGWGLRETNRHFHRERLKLNYIFPTYLTLLKSPVFMGITVCTFLTYGAFFSWFVAGPVLLIKLAGLTPVEFGWVTLIGGGGAYVLSGWLNGKCVGRFGMKNMMRFGWSVCIVSGLFMFFTFFIYGVEAASIIASVIGFYFGSTFIWPNAFSMAFTPFGEIAGYAGALYGSMQIGGAAALGSLVSFLPDQNQLPLAIVFIVAPSLAWGIFTSLRLEK